MRAGQRVLAALACGAMLGAVGVSPGSAAPAGSSTVQVWLTPDLAGAGAFADAVSTPGNPQFHHFLSPDACIAG